MSAGRFALHGGDSIQILDLAGEDLRALGHQPTPVLKAIRAKCLDCSGSSPNEVRDCLVRNCALYPFRLGKNPWRAQASEAQRESGRRMAIAVKIPGNGLGNDSTDGEQVSQPQNPAVEKNRRASRENGATMRWRHEDPPR